MIDFSKFESYVAMTQHFNNNDICKEAIIETRWGAGEQQDIVCPYCGTHKCSKRKDGKFRCRHCMNNFSFKIGTIFEGSRISLEKWFIAMYLISSHKKGISSCQLGRDLNVTQKTAWNMLHKIRNLFAQEDNWIFKGKVECDEVYVGGKEKWKHQSMKTPHTQGRSAKTKTPVFGLMERSMIINKQGIPEPMSYVRAFVVKNTNGATVFTDELKSYSQLSKIGYMHKVCNHGVHQFVCEGETYTNNIECFWGHFRRMITGCYHNVSDAYLQTYVNEASFRWNTRKICESRRFFQMFQKSIGLVKTYKEFVQCF